jgi:type I restriction enzyme M protein
VDFSSDVTSKRSLADIVNNDASVAAAHAAFMEQLEAWWRRHLPGIEGLAPKNGRKGNVYQLRRNLLASMDKAFTDDTLLDGHQVRGAFERYVDDLKADLKSNAASGWGAELVPDDEIVQSQFPEVLADMEAKRGRLTEIDALFTAADEEDYQDDEDTGVLPGDEVKELKSRLKQLKGDIRVRKRDPNLGPWKEMEKESATVEAKLDRHKALEDEARQLKSDLKAAEKKREELVAAAREKIGADEARRLIVSRMHILLVRTFESYLRADQRACVAALENLYDKYAVTAADIEKRRNEAEKKLKDFLRELGYE